jgi:hypothetical protein
MRVVLWLAAVALAAPASAATNPAFEREQRALQEKLVVLDRFLPPEPDAEDARRKLDALIGQVGLRNSTMAYEPRPAVETEREAYVPVDHSGEGTYAQIDLLFAKLGRLPRIVAVEHLGLAWVAEGRTEPRLRYSAVLRLHFWPKSAARPRVPLPQRPLERGVFAEVAPEDLEAFRGKVDLYTAKVAMIERLRHSDRHPMRALAAFDGAPVSITHFAFDAGILHLRGARVLPASLLARGLEAAGMVAPALETNRDGACELFEARGRMSTPGNGTIADRTWMFEPVGPLCDQGQQTASRRIPDATSLISDDGTTFSFELVRSATGARPALVLSRGVMTGAGTGYRILADRRRRYFGYSLSAEPLADRTFRLEIGPLDAETRQRLAVEYGDVLGDPVAIEYPEPQIVASGERLLLDLMVNAKTGERLSDVIRVSAPPPAGLVIQVVNGALHKNGQLLKRTGTAAGARVGFDLEDVGRLVVAFDPMGVGLGTCVHASVKETPEGPFAATMSFHWRNDLYEWASRDPFFPDHRGKRHVFVCLER